MKKTSLSSFLIRFLLILVLLAIIAPVIISITYGKTLNIRNVFSADGLVAYVGATLSSTIAIIIALISLKQNEQEREHQIEKEKEKRLKEILPCLEVSIRKENDDMFFITIRNYNAPAFNLHLNEYPLFPIVSQHEEFCQKMGFVPNNPPYLHIDRSCLKINNHGYPASIHLIYNDMDRNLITQDFTWHHESIYESKQEEYIIRKDTENEAPKKH